MVPAVRPLGSLSMARGCARIDSRPDTAKIGSADRVEVHHARLLAVIGVRKTFPHGLDPMRTYYPNFAKILAGYLAQIVFACKERIPMISPGCTDLISPRIPR
jgi:hypothetical protein